MGKIYEYSRLMVFILGVLIGVQVPGFVEQYGSILKAQARESDHTMALFKQDANKYFAGDMNKLISHYQDTQDPVFRAGGKSISTLYDRDLFLQGALSAFTQSPVSAYLQVAFHPLAEIKDQAWQDYTYRITLNKVAMGWGLAAGMVFALLTELGIFILYFVLRYCVIRIRSQVISS